MTAPRRPWDRVHRRHRLLEAALDRVRRGGPAEIAAMRDEMAAEYAGPGEDGLDGFLRDVQGRWHRAFDARLDAALEGGGVDAPDIVRLWQAVSRTHPQTRSVLDAFAGHPALERAEARHRRMFQAATGLDLQSVVGFDVAASRRDRLTCPLRARRRRRRFDRVDGRQVA
jgi:hypothetical protein